MYQANTKIVKTACNMCGGRCGIDVYLEDEKIVEVLGMEEHPFNTLCVKVRGIPELAHSSRRLRKPLRKVNGEFKEVSWDEALQYIADKLINIKQKYGSKAIVVHFGVPFIYSQAEYMARRFCDLLNTPNYTSGASLCFLARTIGHKLTCGVHVSPHLSGNPNCIMIWGQNPTESRPLQADFIHAMVGRGAMLITVDPRNTPLARKANIHAQIRPGTDCALAMGMLNVIITEELFDKSFVDQWTVGFDKLVMHVKDYSPEKVETITWVKAETIRNMTRMYANNKPASISLGISMDHSTNGIQAIRAITTLMAITGNLDIPGGNTYSPGLRMKNIRLQDKLTEHDAIGIEYPLFTKYTQEQSIVPGIEQMITEKPYPIKALLIDGCNPALTWPNSNKVSQGFAKLDLMVVMEIFMTDTAKMADIVLPGTSFLETENIRIYPNDMSRGGLPLVTKTNRVINPVGDSMEDWKIWAELARKMGYAEYFPWKENEDLFEYLLQDTEITLDQLKRNPGGIYYAERKFQKYLKDGFNTPSKKVEIYSQVLADHGYDPLPTYHEPEESPVSRPDLAEKYPLYLVSGPRVVAYHHSQYRNLPSLRKLVPEPLIEINPKTASRYRIADGDLVMVESMRGSTKLKAKLTENIHPEIIAMQHGWSEANANLLTNDEYRDPVSAYPGFRSVMCCLTKAK
jgi:anaerobic selenocysteine-containing dehydrogenase